LSSYATGQGIALAIQERIEVLARVREQATDRISRRQDTPREFNYLYHCVDQTRRRCYRPDLDQIGLKIFSNVPAGVGLKTSSAVGVALNGALGEAWDLDLTPAELVRISTDAAKAAGVTQAGSLDDTWCSVLGGIVMTDERESQLLERWPAPDDVEVVIFVPRLHRHRVHDLDRRALLSPHSAQFERLFASLSETQNVFDVMSRAAYITAKAFGYRRDLLDLALTAGASGVAISGKGPAVAAVVEAKRVDQVASSWSGFEGSLICTRPEDRGTLVGRSNDDQTLWIEGRAT